MNMAAGSRIGPFELRSLVGAGGMGEVWRALDPRIGREVAIKVLPRDFADDPHRLQRFEREARTAGSLNHPNLVTVFELGINDGSPYIVMELLEGTTLREKLGRTHSGNRGEGRSAGKMRVRTAIDLAVQIASGLAAAHARDVVHRDVKPENIFVTPDGRAKILDFGLVKLSALPPGNDSGTVTLARTTPGVVVGTPAYMSPEQIAGEPVDHRSDIFSFGLVLYEMLCGHRAFHGATPVGTMNAILNDDPPAMDSGQVPSPLAHIVRRCLEKEPERRFHSAHDLAIALEAVRDSQSESTMPIGGRAVSPRIRWWVAAAALAGIAAGVGGYLLLRTPATPPAPTKPAHRLVALTWEPGVEASPSIAPDGSAFVYVAAPFGDPDILYRRIGGETTLNLTRESRDADLQPAFSPDGQSIAFRSDRDGGGIFVMGATGEGARRITTFGFDPAWSPDGREIAFSGVNSDATYLVGGGLWTVDVASGRVERLTDLVAGQPAWSPSGSRIAFSTGNELFSVPRTGGAPVRIARLSSESPQAAWTRDGIVVVTQRASAGTLARILVDESTGARIGEIEEITAIPARVHAPSVSADGRRLVFGTLTSRWKVVRHPFDAAHARLGPPETLVDGSRNLMAQYASPDGRWISAVLWAEGKVEAVLIRTGTGETHRLSIPGWDLEVAWASDNSRILVGARPRDRLEIWSYAVDGSGGKRLDLGPSPGDENPLLSPDGRLLLFTRGGQGTAEATGSRPHLVDLSAPPPRSPVPLAQPEDGAFGYRAWSPDGRWVLGHTTRESSGRTESSLVEFDVRARTYRHLATLKGDAATWSLSWMPDSNRVLLHSRGHAMYLPEREGRLSLLDRATRSIRPLTTVPGTYRRVFLSPDGRSVYGTDVSLEMNIWMLEYEGVQGSGDP